MPTVKPVGTALVIGGSDEGGKLPVMEASPSRARAPIVKGHPVEGATAFQRDVPDAEVHLYDTGHFALEEALAPIAAAIEEFHERRIRRQREVAA